MTFPFVMKPYLSVAIAVAIVSVAGFIPGASGAEKRATIVVDTSHAQALGAAEELAVHLRQIYHKASFEISNELTGNGVSHAIVLGTPSLPDEEGKPVSPVLTDSQKATLAVPGSYIVFTGTTGNTPTAYLVGSDVQGLWHGVYGLLHHLGCGFYLSFDTHPRHTADAFSFDGWQLENRPLVPVRMVFNWHNFLSGCSTWNVKHWCKWIAQSQKMGYNAVMVHAYGNNPMAGFSFQGQAKPVGYLSSTRVGRDWSTNHVNDVRRLYGGDMFQTAVFGPDAAIAGTDSQRTEAARRLMAPVFEFSQQRGMDLYFAVDVDTTSANPQQLIRRLSKQARFEVDVLSMQWMGQEAGKAFLVNPESPEGYGFYKTQVDQLLRIYPQIDCLVVWHRKANTPWMGFARKSMPETWQREYAAELAKTPEAEKFWHSHHLFAQGKIVRAFQRAVAELGRDDVKIAFGSWDFDFLPAAHRFLPANVAFIPLDWMVLKDTSIFDTAQRRAQVAAVASERPVIPIAWAHHDDGNYVGRPYTPYSNFLDRLSEMRCQTAGYGIIHWTTKPLDLYFRSLVNQVWSASRNEQLDATCGRLASDLVGPEQADALGKYLVQWVTTMPKIGRETSDFFVDHELKGLPDVQSQHERRMGLLAAVDRSVIDAQGQEWLDYFAGLERYVLDIYRTEELFNRAKRHYTEGDVAAARLAMDDCHPEKVIERYAHFSQLGGLTRGEQGLIVTMNTRWLTHYVRFRQQIALEPVRYNFAATSHDPLAQSRGIYTFHFDNHQNVWQTLGTKETERPVKEFSVETDVTGVNALNKSEAEVCRSAIVLDAPLRIPLTPIMSRDSRSASRTSANVLPPGLYRWTLLAAAEHDADGQQASVEVNVTTRSSDNAAYSFEPTQGKYLRILTRGSDANDWNSICELQCSALITESSGVSASGHINDYEPAKAVDGDPKTRWAVAGRQQWIQFPLDHEKKFDRVSVLWHEGQRRAYDFEVHVSQDGEQWSDVKRTRIASNSLLSDRITIVNPAAGAYRVHKRTYDLDLAQRGSVELSFTPLSGHARLCGMVLEPRQSVVRSP